MKYIYIIILLILSVISSEEFERHRRSISCKLGTRGCKWSCRLRGYIYGECDQEDHCNCKEVKHTNAYLNTFDNHFCFPLRKYLLLVCFTISPTNGHQSILILSWWPTLLKMCSPEQRMTVVCSITRMTGNGGDDTRTIYSDYIIVVILDLFLCF